MAKRRRWRGLVVKVDEEDMEKLGGWAIDYAHVRKWVNGKVVVRALHHVVLGIEKLEAGKVVDHVNGDPLDCRKSNLRVCSQGENNMNRGIRQDKYKGVSLWRTSAGRVRFQARVKARGVVWSKVYGTEREAVAAYNRKARELHGEFARLNVWRGPKFTVTAEEMAPRPMRGHKAECGCRQCREVRRWRAKN